MAELYDALQELKETIEKKEKEKEIPVRKTEFPVTLESDLTLLHKANTRDPAVVDFQKRADDLFILSKILGVDPRQTKLYNELQSPISELRKAMDTATSGSGSEWVPTGFSADLIGKVEAALKVAALHPRVRMPTDPFKLPALTGFSTARLGAENSAPTGSAVTTANITLDAKKLITYVPLSYELEEDSIIAVLPLIKEDIVKSLARAQENAVINGDDSTSHMDSDTTSAEDVRKAWMGYRKLAVAAAKLDAGNAGADASKLRSLRKLMGIYAIDQNELAWVVGFAVYSQMLALPEVITVDKYGPNATVLTGELAKFDGIPVIVSEYVREDLNATGVFDNSTKDRTVAILVRKDGFIFGDRRDVLVETDRSIKSQTIDMVASQRVAFSNRLPATDKIVAVLYNIKVA